MKNEFMAAKSKPGVMDASGLRSANEMADTVDPQGWTATGTIPGVDAGAGAPVNSASDSNVDLAGKTSHGQPFTGTPGIPGNPDGEIPLAILIKTDEPMGPTEGAGLRSAVGSTVNFKNK
jgi:hypothetical protein